MNSVAAAQARPSAIAEAIAGFRVASIGHFPTALEALPRLSQQAGGALYIKRDDSNGLGLGGNKVRQLSFYLGDALAQGADTVLITGAVQSNYVRCTAAAAAKLGLHCHIQLEQRVSKDSHAYNHSGNVLLNHLFGATVTHYPHGEDEAGADASLEQYAESYRREGRKPYVIHLSMGHTPFGAVGYVDAAREILEQLTAQSLSVDTLVVASGSGHTHAGLLTGLKLANADIKVIGACVRREKTLQEQRITKLCSDIEQLLGVAPVVGGSDIVCDDRFLAPGYGQPGLAAIDAMKAAARFEGIIVDPVYTAKSMACAIAVAANAQRNATTLYIHTGGVPALFGYEDALTPVLTES